MFSEEQFTSLAKTHMDMIFRLAFGYLKSKADADDVTQTVLLRLYKTDKAFESDAHVKHWLLRVTVNECKKLWRSPWNRTEDYDAYAETLTFEEPRYAGLFDAIMALDGKCRAVVVLHYYEGYSIAEISALLGVPAGTVGTRLSRAREKLKQYLTTTTD